MFDEVPDCYGEDPLGTGSSSSNPTPCDAFFISSRTEPGVFDTNDRPATAMQNELYRLCMENSAELENMIAACLQEFIRYANDVLYPLHDAQGRMFEPGSPQYEQALRMRTRVFRQLIRNAGGQVDDDIVMQLAGFMSERCTVFQQYACKLYDIRLQQFIQTAKEAGLMHDDYSRPGQTVYCRCTHNCALCAGKDPSLLAYWRATPNCTPPLEEFDAVPCCRPLGNPIIPCEDLRGGTSDGDPGNVRTSRTADTVKRTQQNADAVLASGRVWKNDEWWSGGISVTDR